MPHSEWKLRGDYIREAAKQQGLNQSDLAALVGTASGHIGRWLNGQVEPAWSAVVKIADILSLPIEMMVERMGSDKALAEERSKYLEGRNLPVVGYIGAGSEDFDPPMFTDGDTPAGWGVLGYETFPANDPHAFVLEVKGDSMTPRYPEGSRIVVVPSSGFRSGHVHYVRDIMGSSYLKIVRWEGGLYQLISFNPDYPVILRRPEEIAEHPTHGLIIWRATWSRPKE